MAARFFESLLKGISKITMDSSDSDSSSRAHSYRYDGYGRSGSTTNHMAVRPKVQYTNHNRHINHDKRNALGYKINMTAADCPEFFRTKGYCRDPHCNFRHSDKALTGTRTCKFWKNPNDPCHDSGCTYRHVPEEELVCAFDGKCNKKFCPYIHIAPRPPLNNMTTIRTNPSSNIKDLEDLLSNHSLQDYHDNFKRKKVGLDLFLGLSEEDLKEEFPEILFGDRLRLIKARDEYNKFMENKKSNRTANQNFPNRSASQGNFTFPDDNNSLYINNIELSTTEDQLRRNFERFGDITKCKIQRDQRGQQKRYGFIHYATKEQAEKAISVMDGAMINNNMISVRFARSKEEAQNQIGSQVHDEGVYVSNLAKSVVEIDLFEQFSPYGLVTRCKIQRLDNGESRGFGFVNYNTKEEATKAIACMNGKQIQGQKIKVANARKRDNQPQNTTSQPVAQNAVNRRHRSTSRPPMRRPRSPSALSSQTRNAPPSDSDASEQALGARPKERVMNSTMVVGKCSVCMDRDVNIVFLDCGHISVCKECANEIRSLNNLCPMCREPIRQIIQVFMN